MAKRQTKKKIDSKKLHKEIQTRAYHIYQERAKDSGTDVSDWLTAENEIKKKFKIK